jgi:hypothetical protein
MRSEKVPLVLPQTSEVASAIGVANAGTPLGGALAGRVAGWIAFTMFGRPHS